MIREHLAAILWLRWRLALNRMRRRGAIGTVLTGLILVGLLSSMVMGFIASLAIGIATLDGIEPDVLLLMWDVIVGVFLFMWIIGVITELQRSEPLSLEKLLHLPISLRGAFLLNYAGSSLSLTMLFFAPIMLGLSLAMAFTGGPGMLMALPLALSFLVMVTALTYQFRGWIAALMMNKRRRGTIIVISTMSIIVVAQLPQLFNLHYFRSVDRREFLDTHTQEVEAINGRVREGQITHDEARGLIEASRESMQAQQATARTESRRRSMEILGTVNAIVPAGWLPYGVRAAAQRQYGPAILGVLGALAIAALSLGRAYATTMRLYTRGGTTRRRRAAEPAPALAAITSTRPRFMERTLPGCSEPATAVALAGFRSLVRSPQAKLLLLTPIVMLIIFGVMAFNRDRETSPEFASIAALAVVGMTMFFLAQLFQNAFGFDRDGFRVFVLSGVPRRDILLGKNLAFAPLVLVLGGAGLAVLRFLAPLPITHMLGALLLLIVAYLLCCVLGNVVSVLAPIGIAGGTLKPVQPRLTTVVKQVLFFVLCPVVMTPIMIPWAVDLGLETMGWRHGLPVFLLLSVLVLVLVAWFYFWILRHEGRLLQHREQRVLEVVTSKAD